MANERNIELLLEGVEAWNAARDEGVFRPELFRPDFSGARLTFIFDTAGKLDVDGHIPLAGADLRWADLSDCDLGNADLSGADLTNANLHRVDLRGAILRKARLRGANLGYSNLSEADLSCAELQFTDLSGATLWAADLSDTDMRGVNLSETDLTATSPWRADLYPEHYVSPEQYEGELLPLKSVADLLGATKTLTTHHQKQRGGVQLYFRGEPKTGFELTPSILRDGFAPFEGTMLLALMSERPEEFNNLGSSLEQWVTAQHHDLKTRFLDISENPLVALFFACEANPKYDGQDGRLHVFAVQSSLVKPFNSDVVSVVCNFAKLHAGDQRLLLGKPHEEPIFDEASKTLQHTSRDVWGQNQDYRNHEYMTAMRRLYQGIRVDKPYFEERIDMRDYYRVFVVVPQQSPERVRAQSAAFLVSAFHERFERDEITKRNDKIPVYAHYTLTIPNESKSSLLEELRLLNITREALFPGLDESARAITEYYRGLILPTEP